MTDLKALAEELARRKHATDPVSVVRRWCPLEPMPSQEEVIRDTRREVLLAGGAGGGKTIAALMAILAYVEDPQYRALVLRRQLTDAKLAHGTLDILKGWALERGARWDGARNAVIFPSGAEIHLSYLKSVTDHLRFQGTEFNAVLFDELTHYEQSQYLYLFSRVGRKHSAIPSRVISTTNPDGRGLAWVKKRFIDSLPEGAKVYTSTYLSNIHIDHANYAQQLAKLDPIQRARLERGEWVLGGAGQVFTLREDHFVDELPPDDAKAPWRAVLGIDLGASQAKPTTAFTVCIFNLYDERVFVERSYKRAGMTPSTIAEEIHRIGSIHDLERIVVDAGGLGAGYVQELTERHGIPAEAAKKKDRYAWLSHLSGDIHADPPRVVILRTRTAQLVEEMAELRWDDTGREFAVGCDDHATDSLLYSWRFCRHFQAEARPVARKDKTREQLLQEEEERMEKALDEQLARRKELGF